MFSKAENRQNVPKYQNFRRLRRGILIYIYYISLSNQTQLKHQKHRIIYEVASKKNDLCNKIDGKCTPRRPVLRIINEFQNGQKHRLN